MADDYIPFAPPDIGDDEVEAVAKVLRSGWMTRGPRCAAFEAAFAESVGAGHALALSSGTAAMHLALEAAGIGPGDEVIVPAMTFCSTALVVEHVGATPVLADVDPVSLNLTAEHARRALTPRTRAIIPVHHAGGAVDMGPLRALATERDLLLVEDAAHAVGTAIGDAPIGSGGAIACFSFYATKNLCTGEGGMLVGPEDLVERARTLSLHGLDRDAWRRYDRGARWRYDVVASGWKYNMTDIQAALGLVQLGRLSGFQARRRAVAEAYASALEGCELLELPSEAAGTTHAWHLYVVRLRTERLRVDRDRVIELMAEAGVGTSVHFIPLHRFSHFAGREGCCDEALPNAASAGDRILSLPLNTCIADGEVARVSEALRGTLEGAAR